MSRIVVVWYTLLPVSLATLTVPSWKLMCNEDASWMPPTSPTSTPSMNTHTSSSPEKSKDIASPLSMPSVGCTNSAFACMPK